MADWVRVTAAVFTKLMLTILPPVRGRVAVAVIGGGS
jgi:hypothetical protein